MSWYGLCFQGGFPLGGLLIGALAARFGVSHSVLYGVFSRASWPFISGLRNRALFAGPRNSG
jgi:hypothetical protein